MFKISILQVAAVAAVSAEVGHLARYAPFWSTFWRGLFFLLPLYLLYLGWLWPFYLSPLRSIPTIPGNPLWGHAGAILVQEPGVAQREWHTRHGLIVRFFWPGGAERLSIAEEDAMQHIMVRNAYNYVKPRSIRQWLNIFVGNGLITSEGHAHREQRKVLSSAFSTASINRLTPIFWRKALSLSEIWQRSAGDGSCPVEVTSWLNRTTLDIICEAAFGIPINSHEDCEEPLLKAFTSLFQTDFYKNILQIIYCFTRAAKYLPTETNRSIARDRAVFANRAADIVATKKVDLSKHEPKDIIALILKQYEQKGALQDETVDLENMRDQVMTFLTAGHETTANTVSWILYLLAKHQGVQRKLRLEILQQLPDSFDPSKRSGLTLCGTDVLDHLHYLNNVCRESMRYLPAIPIAIREALSADVLGGYAIQAKQVVFIFSNAVHRLSHYWGETADQFDPDRWDSLPESFTKNAYLPFLYGPRGCIGRRFAETEMKTILIAILSSVKVEVDYSFPDPESTKMWLIVFKPKNGIHLKISPLEPGDY